MGGKKRGEAALPFLQSHDRRSFVLEDVLIRMYTDVQLGAKLPSLQHSTRVAVVEKVPTAIDPYAVVQDLRGWGSSEDLFG